MELYLNEIIHIPPKIGYIYAKPLVECAIYPLNLKEPQLLTNAQRNISSYNTIVHPSETYTPLDGQYYIQQ